MTTKSLAPKEVLEKLPPLGTDELNARVLVKFFHPTSQWTWYATEYDPKDRVFFGFVVGFEEELGEFPLDDMEEFRGGALNMPIERDLYWDDTTRLQDVISGRVR